jgi:succinate dehydrogenase / fumarate reductase cytochrome b subunit
MSITHRATGVALALGSVLLVVWLAALATEGATGGAFWTCVSDFLSSALGRFMLMGWIWALFYHLCNGLRHLVWDTGRDMDIASVYRSGYAALVLSSVLTLLCWVYAF